MPVLEYKCPNCGGGLELNPTNQKMKCPFCLSEFEQAEIERIFAEQEKISSTPTVRRKKKKLKKMPSSRDLQTSTNARAAVRR